MEKEHETQMQGRSTVSYSAIGAVCYWSCFRWRGDTQFSGQSNAWPPNSHPTTPKAGKSAPRYRSRSNVVSGDYPRVAGAANNDYFNNIEQTKNPRIYVRQHEHEATDCQVTR